MWSGSLPLVCWQSQRKPYILSGAIKGHFKTVFVNYHFLMTRFWWHSLRSRDQRLGEGFEKRQTKKGDFTSGKRRWNFLVTSGWPDDVRSVITWICHRKNIYLLLNNVRFSETTILDVHDWAAAQKNCERASTSLLCKNGHSQEVNFSLLLIKKEEMKVLPLIL